MQLNHIVLKVNNMKNKKIVLICGSPDILSSTKIVNTMEDNSYKIEKIHVHNNDFVIIKKAKYSSQTWKAKHKRY